MNTILKILIVGGYGTFGGRIVELLENETRLTLFVSGRSLRKAEIYCHSRQSAKAQLIPARFNRTENLASQMESLKPDIIIDASGPFQNYGKDAYNLTENPTNYREE